MYKLKFTRLQSGIFRLMCIKAGRALNQREISKILGVSPTGVSKALKLLEREGLARIERSQRINLSSVQLNRDSPKSVAFKRAENLKMIAEAGLEEFLEGHFPGCAIVLFGSYSLGEDTADSDIDIAVIGSKGKDIDVARFEKMLERSITVHYFRDFSSMGKNLKNNILNGILLQGSIKL